MRRRYDHHLRIAIEALLPTVAGYRIVRLIYIRAARLFVGFDFMLFRSNQHG